jgi:hypothetical protein
MSNPTTDGAYPPVDAAASISAGMRCLAAPPSASVAGYWQTVSALSGLTNRAPPPPVAELASASALISLAEQRGAEALASAELELARGKAQSANELCEIDPHRAWRLAQEANLDAQAALSRVHCARLRAAAPKPDTH